jgi:hypothetical protein
MTARGEDFKAWDFGLVDRIFNRHPFQKNFIYGIDNSISDEAKAGCGVALGVEVNEESTPPTMCEESSDIKGCSCFPNSPLLIYESDSFQSGRIISDGFQKLKLIRIFLL